MWLDALDGIFRDDPEVEAKIALLQEYVGSSLLGLATRWQCCLVLDGTGANGKSTVLKVVSALAPPGSRRAIPPQRWGSEYYVASMAGSLLNVVAEMPRTDLENSEAFKAIVAGDEVTGRHPRGEPFDYKPRAGHLFACNKLPGTSDQSDAYWRRFRVILFGRKFLPEEQVRDLAEQIIARELPGIAAWAIEGACRALQAGQLTAVRSSDHKLEEWRKSSDQVALFASERLSRAEGERIECGRLYQAFAQWARESGHKGMSASLFAERLMALGWEIYRNGHAEWVDISVRGAGFARGGAAHNFFDRR
jgi:putative DNA primase/helicase